MRHIEVSGQRWLSLRGGEFVLCRRSLSFVAEGLAPRNDNPAINHNLLGRKNEKVTGYCFVCLFCLISRRHRGRQRFYRTRHGEDLHRGKQPRLLPAVADDRAAEALPGPAV